MLSKIKQYLLNRREKYMAKQELEAKRTVLEELFNDIYANRGRVYKVNFVRGILFGAGSALGGTIVIALIVWILSLFVNFPVVGDTFKNARQSIEQTADDATNNDSN